MKKKVTIKLAYSPDRPVIVGRYQIVGMSNLACLEVIPSQAGHSELVNAYVTDWLTQRQVDNLIETRDLEVQIVPAK